MVHNEAQSDRDTITSSPCWSSINQAVREQLRNGQGTIECLSWTKAAVSVIEEERVSIANGVKIFHCTNNSTTDPHHWLEVRDSRGNQYVWDDTKQKLKNHSFQPKNIAIRSWSPYGDKKNGSIQVYPDFEE